MSLQGKVAVVTGASRGLGKAIALELGAAGATVYVTARGGTGAIQQETAEKTVSEIAKAGGIGIAVHCDQADDGQLATLMQRVEREQGRLDILVNNAFPAFEISDKIGVRFWELSPKIWPQIIDVGLRSHFVASSLAAPMLIRSKGLIVNISSAGGQIYYHSVPYGIGKAGMDRLARDMAHDLQGLGVTAVSLWPGFVRSEFVVNACTQDPNWLQPLLRNGTAHFSDFDPWSQPNAPQGLEATESTHFVGRAVTALASDPDVNLKSGRTLAVVSLADEYGFTDIDGKRPDAFYFRKTQYWPVLQQRGK